MSSSKTEEIEVETSPAKPSRSIGVQFSNELKLHVPPRFYSRIIGRGGDNKRRIEQETNTQIKIPSRGSRNQNIFIKGNSDEDIQAAKEQIEKITKEISSSSSKPNFSHFLSVAFTTEEFKNSFERFKNEVLTDTEIVGIDESLFQNPLKLHITLTMLTLRNEEDEVLAGEILKECKEKFIDPVLQGEPLIVTSSGLEIFSDCKPNSVSVVFGKILSEKLQKIANDIAKYYESKGLIKLDRDDQVLHLTLLNTFFRKKLGVRGGSRTFDATKILEKFKDFHFGTLTVEEIHVSKLNNSKDEKTGYYEAASVLKI